MIGANSSEILPGEAQGNIMASDSQIGFEAMPTYSIAEAKDNFSKLVDQALAGDEVTITRHGKPVAELRAKTLDKPGWPSPDLVAQLAERAKKRTQMKELGVDAVRKLRDDFP